MSIENKFTVKFLKSLFTQLNKEWGDQSKIYQLENDPWDFEEFLGVLEKIYGFTNQDDRLPEWMTREPLPPHDVVFDVSKEDLDRVFDFLRERQYSFVNRDGHRIANGRVFGNL